MQVCVSQCYTVQLKSAACKPDSVSWGIYIQNIGAIFHSFGSGSRQASDLCGSSQISIRNWRNANRKVKYMVFVFPSNLAWRSHSKGSVHQSGINSLHHLAWSSEVESKSSASAQSCYKPKVSAQYTDVKSPFTIDRFPSPPQRSKMLDYFGGSGFFSAGH